MLQRCFLYSAMPYLQSPFWANFLLYTVSLYNFSALSTKHYIQNTEKQFFALVLPLIINTFLWKFRVQYICKWKEVLKRYEINILEQIICKSIYSNNWSFIVFLNWDIFRVEELERVNFNDNFHKTSMDPNILNFSTSRVSEAL